MVSALQWQFQDLIATWFWGMIPVLDIGTDVDMPLVGECKWYTKMKSICILKMKIQKSLECFYILLFTHSLTWLVLWAMQQDTYFVKFVHMDIPFIELFIIWSIADKGLIMTYVP